MAGLCMDTGGPGVGKMIMTGEQNVPVENGPGLQMAHFAMIMAQFSASGYRRCVANEKFQMVARRTAYFVTTTSK